MGLLDSLPPPPAGREGWPWNVETESRLYDPALAWPKISVVTPSLNQGCFVEETIRSVLLQNYPNLEYIVIDGNSGDETVAVLRKYEKWLAFWSSEPDSGQSEAINKGMARCTGRIFNWINSDDRYAEGALFTIGRFFMDHPEALVLCGAEWNYYPERPEKNRVFPGTVLKSSPEETIFISHIVQSPTFFRMEAIRALGPLRQDLHFIMDAEYWMRFLLRFGCAEVYSIPDVLTHFRLHEDSKTISRGRDMAAERRWLKLQLARFAGAPPYLLKVLEQDLPVPEPAGLDTADTFSGLNRKKVLSFFTKAHYEGFYAAGCYRESRQALLYYLWHGKVEWNLHLLGMAARVLFLPTPLRSRMRKIRSVLKRSGEHE